MKFNRDAELIIKYLDKTYVIKDNRFYYINSEVQDWGDTIAYSLVRVFSFEKEVCDAILKTWALASGLDAEEISAAYTSPYRHLRCEWTPELAQDIQAYHSFDAEAELTALLAEEMGRTIDRKILTDIFNLSGSTHSFLSIVR